MHLTSAGSLKKKPADSSTALNPANDDVRGFSRVCSRELAWSEIKR